MTQTSLHTEELSLVSHPQANALAERLEEGARALAVFATRLTDAEWQMRVPHDGRSVGVVVHHVASVYPIEVQLAQTIASGKAVTGVVMDDIHAMNAKPAAASIRALTDEQLLRAAPVSLYDDAPLTCQFVLEDHAVRHSYHHLARLRRTVQS